MNYINEARKIITDCYAALKPSEQLRREAAEEQCQGHITEGYARELTKGADAEALQLRQAAGLKLAGLAQQYTDAAKAADMPDGQALQSGDYALLSANFPMSVEEYQKLCERNKNNPTLLRAAIDYGNRNGGIAPYAKRYYKSAADRIKLFDEFIKRCKAVLEADPTNPARGDAYWNMIARDAEPWATL